ncbi:PREDICTED: probable cytokinin riboside 5'-monophosphate phosphoribohydrolase LOGL10 [Prunus mume]|uniref:Probable cytokinin riboside 5'-monophosphate phosphoribohydrolase LOGL10 n=1 Tax=Prunus mume TaxID=102107 RepID=A0ABM0NMN8_PRUMU|nr:PREDICTED: probable cytokinin riboside 5'-monophosphate phosphoribohydrolase LOGL10 [Prunus mume]
MGFSVLDSISMGSHVLVKSCHERTLKIQSFWARERPTISAISFKLSRSRPYPHPGRLISCKSELVDFDERTSPNEVRKEIERCYELIHRLGRGVVYLGSSRMGPDHSHYLQALELGREIANLLECTSWTGAGPGLMDAAMKGALQAGKLVGGFKIGKEAGEWTASNFHPYLPSEVYLTCRFFSARKHGLVDAAVRSCSSDRTAVVALPGGIGTLDEIFEILALIQLERIGSELPVPFLLMNYDSFYSKLLGFLDDCEDWGTLSKGEITSLWTVCDSNSEALAYLADFYELPPTDKARHDNELQSASGTFS